MKNRIIEVDIISLGGMGDGCGYHDDKPVYVPFTLEGDRVAVEVIQENRKLIRGRLKKVITPGPGRAEPACRHFALCGGCQLQHLNEEEYYLFKRTLLMNAVERAGFSAAFVEDPVEIGPCSRRKVRFKVKAGRGTTRIGFYENKTHRVVDLKECLVIDKRISYLLFALRKTVAALVEPAKVTEISVTHTDGYLEICIFTGGKLKPDDRKLLNELAQGERISSIYWERNSGPFAVCESKKTKLACGEVEVSLPQGAFIQATAQGQQAIAEIILEETSDSTKVIDLYSGCGSYAFPLASAGHIVKAVEGASSMVAAMESAILENDLSVRMTAEERDLYKNPFTGAELRGYDAIVVNPPRNGAEPQMEAIASSEVPLVIIVSCNPLTLERDAKILDSHGYQMVRAIPVDQFFWTTHLESVVVFRKIEEELSFL